MIVITATVHAKTGKESQFQAELQKLVVETRKEEGCLQYDLHRGAEDAGAFLFYERWRDADAIEAHFKTPHIAAVFALIDEMADAPPVITRYDLLD